MRRLTGLAAAAAVLVAGVAAAVVVPASPAAAAGGCPQQGCEAGGGGLTSTVRVVITGDGASGSGGSGGPGTYTRAIPSYCEWYSQFANMRVSSLAELRATGIYDEDDRYAANDMIWDNPPDAWWDQMLAREAAGEELYLYEPVCADGNSSSGGDLTRLSEYGARSNYGQFGIYLGAPGTQPQPQIDPFSLVQVAREFLDLGEPLLDHNPKAPSLGGGTLVGLDTYFWVTDPRSLGGGDGVLAVRAAIGPVWAEVSAANDGLSITSGGSGTTNCTRAQGLTRYGSGGTPCAVEFARSSIGQPGGWPVTATTTWQARYELSDGQTGGLGTETAVAPDQFVPVGESQALVRSAG